jgi:hypothetical protein
MLPVPTFNRYTPTRDEADNLVEGVRKWMQDINNHLVLTITEQEPNKGLVGYARYNAANTTCGNAPDYLFIYSSKDIYINIGFSSDVNYDSTLEEVRAKLNYVALNKLPMPGFECPQHWTIYPMTPVSSFKNGVDIIEFGNGRIKYTVKTNFFSVYGTIPSLHVCDRASAKGTYFSVENRDLSLDMTVDLPMFSHQ